MNGIRQIVERPGLTGEMEAALHVTLLRELAQGQPVTIERLAKSLSWQVGHLDGYAIGVCFRSSRRML